MLRRAGARSFAGALLFALAACDPMPASDASLGSDGRTDGAGALEAHAPPSGEAHSRGTGDSDPAHAACRAERTALETRVLALQARILGLEAELGTLASERFERESEWLEHTRALAKLGTVIDLPATGFRSQVPEVEADARVATDSGASSHDDAELARTIGTEPVVVDAPSTHASTLAVESPRPAPTPAVDPIARMRKIDRTLRSLFTIEQVTGLDLLESGVLEDGAIGPVVLRVLDERGRPIGSLCADRLRLECSRAARSLTLVLENGYERRGGERIPFSGRGATAVDAREIDPMLDETDDLDVGGLEAAELSRGGERRVLLPDVDPAPWIEALPELFGDEAKDASQDDGRWDLRALRAALNELLREDAAGGYYRVQGLAGVQGVVIRDVLLFHLDREGRIERRLFADRMSILTEEQGLQILLEDGAQIRGEEKSAFLEGRYRIFLPSADKKRWSDASVPGLSPAPERARPGGARKP